ncbi:MAG TPA: peptidoglycan editing factor PgeF [Beijerinckiaceae bacterium]|jgi:YfiH family protein
MFIEAPELAAYPTLRHAFFTRQGGVSEGLYASLNGGLGSADDQARVRENRRRMAEQLEVAPEAMVSLHQVHSAVAITVDTPWTGERPKADALVTATEGLALAIATADCGPVLFADPEARVIGAAHAGWRGAVHGVLEATLHAMEELGARRSDITAVLGPTIGPNAYEVGPEFVAQLLEADASNDGYLRPSTREGHAYFDLPAYIVARLRTAGVGVVADLELCTYSDAERFYSYRRTTHRGEPDYGRLISAIALSPPSLIP